VSERSVLNCSELPEHAFDGRAPIWWGNLLLLAIESTMFGIVIACYFYFHQNFSYWPPPRNVPPTTYDTAPDLLAPTSNVILLLLSCVPMYLLDRAARAGKIKAVRIAIVVSIIFGAAAVALRCFEFRDIHFKWDANAYGSIVWAVLSLHFAHLITGTLETAVLGAYVFAKGLDAKHRVDLTVTAVYWYWIVGVWIPLYAILYWGPRLG